MILVNIGQHDLIDNWKVQLKPVSILGAAIMIIKFSLAAICLSSLITTTALAAVSQEQASALGKSLTPVGAEIG